MVEFEWRLAPAAGAVVVGFGLRLPHQMPDLLRMVVMMLDLLRALIVLVVVPRHYGGSQTLVFVDFRLFR
jgi:hypothetical protein